MKKIISLLLVLVLCISNINIVKAETKSDKDFAIELIDGLIGELKAIGYNNCYDENFGEINSKSYNWKIKHDEILKNIYVNGYSVYNDIENVYDVGTTLYSKIIYSTYGIIIPEYSKVIDYYAVLSNGTISKTTTTIVTHNYFYVYLSELEIIKQTITQDKAWSLKDLIEEEKKVNAFDNLTNMMWVRQYFRTTFILRNTLKQSYTFTKYENIIARSIREMGEVDSPRTKEQRFNAFNSYINDIIKEIGNANPEALPAEVEVKNKTTLPTVAKTTKTQSNNVKTISKKLSLQINNLKLTKRVKGIKVSFNKCNDATKYQIQVSLKKNFKNKKTYNTTKTTKIIKKLKSKKKYFVRVRAINGSNKSAWVVKKIKTK